MGGPGMRLRLCPWRSFSGLAILLNMIETAAGWPQGLLDAYVAMIPKYDGDSTLWSSAPFVFSSCSLHAVGLPQAYSPQGLGTGLGPTVCVMGCRLSRPGFPLRWILRRSYPVLWLISCMSWLRMSLSLVIRWIGPFLAAHLGALVCSPGSGRFILLTIIGSGLGSSWLLGWVSVGAGMGGIPQGCPLSMVFIVALCVPWCGGLSLCPSIKLYADNLMCCSVCPNALFGAARFTVQHARSVGQDVSPGKCVLHCTSKAVRKSMKLWDVSGDGRPWTVELDVAWGCCGWFAAPGCSGFSWAG